ncbi:transcription factor-like protein [Oryza sativa Japonica Group]|uniref:Transcription factor-like protein n=1 Tax=Oryza sativa subsp. japonica TaxID=39947 RepID=Q5QLI3_ORYSJ|nr:transcription factor-like protein [Oryza sativa Japonica Group]BAD73738.1 transcription factor-like protein [Oryza sativa Japonica Group]
MAVCKMFDERPVWPRQSLYECLIDDGLQISQSQFKRLLFRAGYYFSTGPFGKFWIRRGYDPRKDPDSRMFQRIDFRMPPELRNLPRKERRPEKWTEMCKLEVMPSKSFIFLQLFELKDDFIQAEIRKPSHQPTCSRCLTTCDLVVKSFSPEASDRHNGTEDQAGGNNSDSEDAEDDEEEDKESDGYESPPMADDVPDFTLDDPCILDMNLDRLCLIIAPYFTIVGALIQRQYSMCLYSIMFVGCFGYDTSGEGFSNGYLEEMLRNFPLHEDGQNKPGDAPNNTEASDGEFEIYEQPSDDEESSDG